MSEERFDRLESQLTQVIQGMTVMQQNMAVMQQNMTVMQQNMATKQDLADLEEALRNRIDSVDGTLSMAIREGFNRLHEEITDLNIDLAIEELKTENIEIKTESNERKVRRLNQRLFRLEGGSN